MPLKLVKPSPPSPKQAVVERVKKMPRQPGMLQCNRCGGQAVVTVTAGASIKDGRYQRGTVITDRECLECWKQGIFSPMQADLKPIK